MGVIDDFEDQDVSDWSWSSQGLNTFGTAADSPPNGGSYCGEFGYAADNNNSDSTVAKAFTATSASYFAVWFKEVSESDDDIAIQWYDSGAGADPFRVNMRREQGATNAGQIIIDGSTGVDASTHGWLRAIWHNVDFSANTYDWRLEDATGTTLASGSGASFRNDVDSVDEVRIVTQALNETDATYRIDRPQWVTAPAGPTTLTVDATTSAAVDLSADDNSSTEDGFAVHRSTTAGFTPSGSTQIADIAANADATVTYTDSDPVQGDTNYYQIGAYNEGGTTYSNEASTLVPVPAPDLGTLTPHDASIDVPWTDNADDETDYKVYWRPVGGTWSSTSAGANTTSHTITGLDNGTDYEVYVEAVGAETTATSATKTTTTTVSTVTGASLDASVTDQFTLTHDDTLNAGSYRTEFKESSASDWLAALASRTTLDAADALDNWSSATNIDLATVTNPSEDGTAVEATHVDNGGSGTQADETTLTLGSATDCGDAIQFWLYTDSSSSLSFHLRLDDGSTTEVVEFTGQVTTGQPQLVQVDTSGYASVDTTAVTALTIVPAGLSFGDRYLIDSVAAGDELRGHDDTDLVIPYLEDGEEYDVRVRGEGPDAVGAWTTVTAVTKWPPITGLQTTAVTKTSIDWSWTDVYDNEDEWTVTVERVYDAGHTAQLDQTTYGPNRTTHSDATLSPGNTYRLTLRAATEHVFAEGTLDATTTSSGKPRKPVGSQGWFVEVEHPDSGAVHRPTVLDDPLIKPTANALPEIEIPVPADEKWMSDAFDDAPMEVWKDGDQQPIDELTKVRPAPDRYVLVGRGGGELEQPIEKEVDQQETHLLAKDLIQNNTTYATNVDAPATTVRKNEQAQSADTQAEFQSVTSLAAADPFEVTGDGKFRPLQPCHVREGRDFDRDSGTGFTSSSAYSNGEALRLAQSGAWAEWDITLPYTIPEQYVGLKIRQTGSDVPELAYKIESTEVDSTSSTTTDIGSIRWWANGDGAFGGPGWSGASGGDLSGTATVRIEVVSHQASEQIDIDVLALYDKRFESSLTFDNTVDANGYLSGPALYPEMTFEFDDFTAAQTIRGGRIEATLLDGQTLAEVAFSNDGGVTWPLSATDTNTYEADFADAGGTLRWRATFEGWGSRDTATPTTGFNPQEIDAYTLYADIGETPVTTNWSDDDHLKAVLNYLARQGNFVWEYRLRDGTPTIEWTQPGQRTSSKVPEVADYQVEKDTSGVYESVTVIGSARSVRKVSFQSKHDKARSLPDDHLVDGSETVYDPDSGTNYERGADYQISYLTGEITVLSTGSMTDATAYEIDYEAETRGSYTDDSVSSPRVAPNQPIPGLTSDTAATLSAISIVNQISEPRIEATVTLPADELGFRVVEAIQIPGVPTNGRALQITGTEHRPGEAILRLEAESVGDVVERLREQVSQVAKRT